MIIQVSKWSEFHMIWYTAETVQSNTDEIGQGHLSDMSISDSG